MKTRRKRIEDFVASLQDAILSEDQTAFLFTTGGTWVANDGCYNNKCVLNSDCQKEQKSKKTKSLNYLYCTPKRNIPDKARNQKCVLNVGIGCTNTTDNCKPLKI